MRENLWDRGLGKEFLDLTPKSQLIKSKVDKQELSILKNINPRSYGQLIYNKGGKHIKQGRGSLFNNCCWKNWTVHAKKFKWDRLLRPFTKTISKQIEELDVRLETIRLLEETGSKLWDTDLSNGFAAISPEGKK